MPPRTKTPSRAPRPFPIVALGGSAGGTEAVVEILRNLPERPGLAFVVIQHLDPTHESLLGSVLDKATSLTVREAKEGEKVRVDHVYVIPPNKVLRIRRRTLRLAPRAPRDRIQRPIDAFFASLAEDAGPAAIAVLLSGSGTDGVSGMEAVKAQGGITMAQDERSARFPEMPRAAVQAGAADLQLAPKVIARELQRIGSHPYVQSDVLEPAAPPDDPRSLTRLFEVLRRQTQVDFSHYKRPTLRRRIARRMALHKSDSLSDYVRYVSENPKEADALHQDMLIKVTGFFRDPAVFSFLQDRIFPALLKGRPRNTPIRIWVPGCATGEEAYSIAICALESLSGSGQAANVQVFATDVSETALERARAGVYPETIAADLSPDRLRRFFTRVQGGYQIAKFVRDMCVIARQDLVKDPPFSKLDLVSCRNVLIYLEAPVHRRLFPIFHYALRPGGYLLLGTSETVGSFSSLFSLIDRKHKIYQRRPVAAPVRFDIPAAALDRDGEVADKRKPAAPVREADLQKEVDRLLLAHYAPPGVVVNGEFEILQFRGDTERYLQPSPGKASLNVLKMVREGLLHQVKSALQRAKREGKAVRTDPAPFAREGRMSAVRIEVVPLEYPREVRYLVLFLDAPPPFGLDAVKGEKGAGRAKALETLVDQMKQELVGTKEHLQSIIEEQETTNEELKSANEEILSSNEELQSTNEELETAKEELQSTNEELTTLNEELQARNQELSLVNNDIGNLLASVNLPIVMLGNDLRIRRYTPQAEKVLHVVRSDLGRPITDIRPGFKLPDLERLVVEAIDSVTTVVREVRDRQGHWYSLRIRPYMTQEKKIEGAVLMLVDIDAHKKRLDEIAASLEYADAVIQAVEHPLLVLGPDLRVQRANPAFCRSFKARPEEVVDRPFADLDGGAWAQGDLVRLLEPVATEGRPVRNLEMPLRHPRFDGLLRLRINARRALRAGTPVVLVAIEVLGASGEDGM